MSVFKGRRERSLQRCRWLWLCVSVSRICDDGMGWDNTACGGVSSTSTFDCASASTATPCVAWQRLLL